MKNLSLLLCLVAVLIIATGCDNPATSEPGKTDTQLADDGHDHAAHDHSAKHGGHLIEIGRNHEYHAELVDDHKTESITIYLMDSHMEPLTLNESSISLVLTAVDKTETFELSANQSGGSSEYSSNDAKMMEMIDGDEVKGKIRISIDGKPFSGAFDHHGHDHGEADGSHAEPDQ